MLTAQEFLLAMDYNIVRHRMNLEQSHVKQVLTLICTINLSRHKLVSNVEVWRRTAWYSKV